ncbi:MAG: hypothetical protein OXF42_03565 [Candidatus Dadabacteria bacterium]|nr:hypothetical protein [Candidatus Dadabacteria bacterium]
MKKKKIHHSPLSPLKKIEIIKSLEQNVNIYTTRIFDDFYNNKLRNAISHSDYILTDKEFRCRDGFRISLETLHDMITKSKIFISSFFALDKHVRKMWGKKKNQAMPYDPQYKGLLEIIVDNNDLMCGFKIHWPNNSESIYKRTQEGVEMVNCMEDHTKSTIDFMVGMYAQNPGAFSPLVEKGQKPIYTKLEDSEKSPEWSQKA